MIGDDKAMVVWESCSVIDDTAYVRWNGSEQETAVSGIHLYQTSPVRVTKLYRAFIDHIQPGPLTYEISTSKGSQTKTNSKGKALTISRGKSKYKFQTNISHSTLEGTWKMAIVGDNQNGPTFFSGIISKIINQKPNVFLHLGDMVQYPWDDFDWSHCFFEPLRSSRLLETVPFVISQGNHDVYWSEVAPYFAPLKEFKHKPTGYYYAQSIGGIRLIVLDSNTEDRAQVQWLEVELQRNESLKADFRIISVHVPPFIEYWEPNAWRRGEHRWPQYVRNNMVQLFEKYNVDLVLSGHQHNYQRGTHNNVTYVITGGGGGTLDYQQVEIYDMYEKTIIDHHHLMMEVSPHQLHLRMCMWNGEEGDRFTINRRGALA